MAHTPKPVRKLIKDATKREMKSLGKVPEGKITKEERKHYAKDGRERARGFYVGKNTAHKAKIAH